MEEENIFDQITGSIYSASIELPYTLPTAIRKIKEGNFMPLVALNKHFDKVFGSENLVAAGRMIGFCVGFAVGTAASYVFQIMGYIDASSNGNPEVLAMPLLTNIASGFYELYRHSKDSLEKRNLESKL